MQVIKLVKPTALFAAVTMPSSAFAVTIAVDYTASFAGTAINIGGAASPQYTFQLQNGGFGGTKTFINVNFTNDPGARIGFPGSPPTLTTAQTSTAGTKSGDFFINGDYSLLFDIGNQAYTGTATVDQQGRHISSITYNAVGAAAVPEVSTWAMMILGLGGAGAAVRRQRRQASALATA